MLDKKLLKQNIIESLGLSSLPEERQAALIEKLSELVEKRVTLRIIEGISEEDARYFAENVADKGDEEKGKFLMEKFPNFLEMVQEEIEKVKSEVLADAEV